MSRKFLNTGAFVISLLVAFAGAGSVEAQSEPHNRGRGRGPAPAPDSPQTQQGQHQQQKQQQQVQLEQQHEARRQQEQAVRKREETARKAQEAARIQEQAAIAHREDIARKAEQAAKMQQQAAAAEKERETRRKAEIGRMQQHAAVDHRPHDVLRQAETIQPQQAVDQRERETSRKAEIGRMQQHAAVDRRPHDVLRQVETIQPQQAVEQRERESRREAELGRMQQQAAVAEKEREARRKAEIGATQDQAAHPRKSLYSSLPFAQGVVRPFNPAPLNLKTMPFEKAVLMPVLDAGAGAEDREHAQQVRQCLRRHLLSMESPPPVFNQVQTNTLNSFLNNYQTILLGQSVSINRGDTYVTPVPRYEYPSWWHPDSGWMFSNGFTLGGAVNVGRDWLRSGWHPYYGPPPDGFVCASNYVPTPFIYYPAYGLWRLAGAPDWASAGPPADYTGPISVEMLEQRKVSILDPYTGRQVERVINVPYLYNGFYFPEYGRWGYTNRHGNFLLISP